MKFIFLLLVFFSFSNSKYLLTLEKINNSGINIYCIDNYSYDINTLSFVDVYNDSYSLSSLDYKSINVEDGYKFVSGSCSMDRSKTFGLSYNQFNFLMALYGILLSCLVAFAFVVGF